MTPIQKQEEIWILSAVLPWYKFNPETQEWLVANCDHGPGHFRDETSDFRQMTHSEAALFNMLKEDSDRLHFDIIEHDASVFERFTEEMIEQDDIRYFLISLKLVEGSFQICRQINLDGSAITEQEERSRIYGKPIWLRDLSIQRRKNRLWKDLAASLKLKGYAPEYFVPLNYLVKPSG